MFIRRVASCCAGCLCQYDEGSRATGNFRITRSVGTIRFLPALKQIKKAFPYLVGINRNGIHLIVVSNFTGSGSDLYRFTWNTESKCGKYRGRNCYAFHSECPYAFYDLGVYLSARK